VPSLPLREETVLDREMRVWIYNVCVCVCACVCVYCLSAGGIEMAACSHLKRVNVHVYQRSTDDSYKRISCFDCKKGARMTVRVLYCGGTHYDAMVTGPVHRNARRRF